MMIKYFITVSNAIYKIFIQLKLNKDFVLIRIKAVLAMEHILLSKRQIYNV
jgi:hypothetical protein